MSNKKAREVASTGAQSEVGQERKEIYKSVWTRVNDAIAAGYWLEAVTLLESVMADRLEAYRAHRGRQSVKAREMMPVGTLAKKLRDETGANKSAEIEELLDRVSAWSKRRNEVLHELAKLVADVREPWRERYARAQKVATDGKRLANEVKNFVQKHNKPARSSATKWAKP